MKDYFSILGVNQNSTPDEIKKAYRSLAMKHHPDRGGDQAKFQEIQEAYDILTDPVRRANIDNMGRDGFHSDSGDFHFNFAFGPGGMDINEIFRNFHNGGNPFNGFQQRQRRNRDLRVVVELDLASTLESQIKHISVMHLNGSRSTVTIEIPKGISANMQMKYAGQGDHSAPELAPGDLYIDFRILPHKDFRVEGIDLHKTIKLNCLEAITGTTVNFNSLEGKTLSWSVPAGTQPNTKYRIPNYGLWAVDHPVRGSIIINFEITVPTNLNGDQLLAIEKIIKDTNSKENKL